MGMQKVLMLSNFPGMKTTQFTRWIVMINQSIAPLGEFKNNIIHKPKGYLWHTRESKEGKAKMLQVLCGNFYWNQNIEIVKISQYGVIIEQGRKKIGLNVLKYCAELINIRNPSGKNQIKTL